MTAASLMTLHLGVVTGWACGSVQAKPRYGAWRLAENVRASPGETGAGFLDAASDHVKVFGRPDAIIVSAPLTEAPDENSAKAAVLCIGLAMVCQLFAYRRAIPVSIVSFDAVRKDVSGDSSLRAWCRAQGYEPKHEASEHALLLFDYIRRRDSQ